jgi:hypothetical protein
MFMLKSVLSYEDGLRQFKDEDPGGLFGTPDETIQYQLESIFIRGYCSGVIVALSNCQDDTKMEGMIREMFEAQSRLKDTYDRLKKEFLRDKSQPLQ